MRDILFLPPVFDSVLFQDSQGPGLPNQSTKLQNSNFPTYKRTLHHKATMWMRKKHAHQGAQTLPPQEVKSKSTLNLDGLRIRASSVAIASIGDTPDLSWVTERVVNAIRFQHTSKMQEDRTCSMKR